MVGYQTKMIVFDSNNDGNTMMMMAALVVVEDNDDDDNDIVDVLPQNDFVVRVGVVGPGKAAVTIQ